MKTCNDDGMAFGASRGETSITLTTSEALVLAHWLGRLEDADQFEPPDAEELQALANLNCLLENALAEQLFSPRYQELVEQARVDMRPQP